MLFPHWPACTLNCLTAQGQKQPKFLCATILPGDKGPKAEALLQRIVNATYEGCRSKDLELANFPDFEPVLAEMNSLTNENEVKAKAACDFKVTNLMPCGSLVVKEQFFKQFLDIDDPLPEFEALIAKHNETYNKDGKRLSDPGESARIEDVEMPQNEVCEVIKGDKPLNHESVAALPNARPPQNIAAQENKKLKLRSFSIQSQ